MYSRKVLSEEMPRDSTATGWGLCCALQRPCPRATLRAPPAADHRLSSDFRVAQNSPGHVLFPFLGHHKDEAEPAAWWMRRSVPSVVIISVLTSPSSDMGTSGGCCDRAVSLQHRARPESDEACEEVSQPREISNNRQRSRALALHCSRTSPRRREYVPWQRASRELRRGRGSTCRWRLAPRCGVNACACLLLAVEVQSLVQKPETQGAGFDPVV